MYVAQRVGGFVGNRVGVPDLRSWRPGTDFFARRFYSVSSPTSSVVMFRMGNPSFGLNQTASVETIPCLQTKGRGTQASLHTAPPPIDVDHCSNLDHKNTPYMYTRNSYTLLLRPLLAQFSPCLDVYAGIHMNIMLHCLCIRR